MCGRPIGSSAAPARVLGWIALSARMKPSSKPRTGGSSRGSIRAGDTLPPARPGHITFTGCALASAAHQINDRKYRKSSPGCRRERNCSRPHRLECALNCRVTFKEDVQEDIGILHVLSNPFIAKFKEDGPAIVKFASVREDRK